MSIESERAAVEVVTLFETTILDSRHLDDPSPPRLRSSTVALIASGAIGLTGAFTLFLIACFSAFAGGLAGDVAVALLLAGGVTALVAGLVRRAAERAPRDFTVGSAPSATIHVAADLPLAAFPLVRADGDGWQLLFSDRMSGEVAIDNLETSLATAIAAHRVAPSELAPGVFRVPLTDGVRARLALGATTFHVRAARAPRRYPVPLRVDGPAVAWLGAVVAAFALGLALLFSLPPDAHALSLDPHSQLYKVVYTLKPQQEDPLATLRGDGKLPDDGGAKGRAQALESGKMGSDKSKNRTGRFQLKGPEHNPDPHLAQRLAAERAAETGVLGFIKKQSGGAFSSLLSRDSSALGSDSDTVMGGLLGREVGDAYGDPNAAGIVGHGPGGGGDGINTIGIGNRGFGIEPGGGGGNLKYGFGPGLGTGLHGHRPKAPDPAPSMSVTVTDNYPKYLIRQVVHQHSPEVKFCYDKELMKNPKLYGRVVIRFTIAGMGQVVASGVQQSTLKSQPVEDCIAGAVRRWQFPKPNNGIVMVSYPFTLQSAGTEQ